MKIPNFNKGQIHGGIMFTSGAMFFNGQIAYGILLLILSILLLIEYIKNKDQDLEEGLQSSVDELREAIKKNKGE